MAKSKILIVDDDPGILTMLQLMLRLEGYDAIVCGEPRLVVDTMASEKPDLVLLDALMPGFDGIQVLEAVKARALSIPVILVTGNANEAYLKSAMQAGAKGVLAKPFVKEDLLDQLGKFLEKKS
jgi:DNA-binding NtrC family response regulator